MYSSSLDKLAAFTFGFNETNFQQAYMLVKTSALYAPTELVLEHPELSGVSWDDDTMTKPKWTAVILYNSMTPSDPLDLQTALTLLGEDGILSGKTTTAVIVADESDWILPLWPMTNGTDNSSRRHLRRASLL